MSAVPSAAEAAAGPLVERFARGSGQWLGWFGVVVGATTLVIATLNGWDNWREICLGFAIAIVSWVVLIRPQASLHEHGVFFRNMVRDAFIPASKIEACHTAQSLMVRAEAIVYHCPAITRSARSIMREKHGGRAGVLGLFGGLGGSNAQAPSSEEYRFGEEVRTSTTYASYVESRVLQAAQQAEPDDRTAVTSWAWLPIIGSVFSVLAVAAMFV
ncbi:MAG TPA: hypothetical protein VLK34_06660 [Nocardioidaceae bacterium]|nr:hypothetical protein [Nocardioidaceae bacterium]